MVKYTEAQSSIKSDNACILCFILAMVRFIYESGALNMVSGDDNTVISG